MPYHLILNPRAGRGRAARTRAVLEAELRRAGVAYRLHETDRPGHATDLARAVAEEATAVVAVGGDGTVHEVVRGLLAAEAPAPLGVVPIGSGNDLAKALGLPRRPAEALGIVLAGATDAVDIGWLTVDPSGNATPVPFINAVGIGFDAQVAADVQARRRLPGLAGYVVAVLRALTRWSSPPVRIRADDRLLYDGPLMFATVGNGVASGGTFYLTPDADLTDGLLDLCIVKEAPLLRILFMLPRAMRPASWTAPEVVRARGKDVRVEVEAPLPVHADGEVIARGARCVEVRLQAAALRVFVPGGRGGEESDK